MYLVLCIQKVGEINSGFYCSGIEKASRIGIQLNDRSRDLKWAGLTVAHQIYFQVDT